MGASTPNIATELVADGWRELANRDGDGLAVTLLWSKSTNQVKVTVADAKSEDAFELEVDGAEALAAFHHPFAYATCQRLALGGRAHRTVDLQPQN